MHRLLQIGSLMPPFSRSLNHSELVLVSNYIYIMSLDDKKAAFLSSAPSVCCVGSQCAGAGISRLDCYSCLAQL